MKFSTPAYCLLALLLLLGVAVSQADLTEAQRKSRHFATAAMESGANGDVAASHELYKRAYRLDPTNLAAGYSLALGNLSTLDDNDTIGLKESLRLMRQYVDAYPADNNEGEYYAQLCGMVGHTREAIRVTKRIADLYPSKTELLPAIADHYMRLQEFDSALHYFSLYEVREGQQPALTLRKVVAYMMQNDSAAALHEAGAGIRANPALPEGYLLKSMIMPYVGKPDSALYYMRKAEEIAPDDAATKVALAKYYEDKGDSVMYDKYTYEALLLDDLDMEQKLELLGEYVGPIIEKHLNTARADRLFNELRDQYPHEAAIQDFAARYSYAKEQYSEAAEQIGIAIDMEPDNYTYRLQQLTYLLGGQLYDRAADAFEQLPAEMTEGDFRLLYLGSVALASAKRNARALDVAARLINMVTPAATTDSLPASATRGLSSRDLRNLSDTYTLMGDVYYQMQDYPAMYRAYDNALTADPENPGVLNNYAYYLTQHGGDLDKALTMSTEANRLEPGNPTYIDTLAWVLFKKGDYKAALEQQLKALEEMDASQPSAEFFEHMGDIYFMNSEPAKAVEMWEKALPLDPDNSLLRKKLKHKTYFYE